MTTKTYKATFRANGKTVARKIEAVSTDDAMDKVWDYQEEIGEGSRSVMVREIGAKTTGWS